MSAIRLIAGLGNPGPEYTDTRHNAGFRFLDVLCAQLRCSLRNESRFSGSVAKTAIADGEVWLLAPQTFMNNSGGAVAALARFYKIAPAEILIVHDELDLAPGVARLKRGGGTGGHNGLSDIVEKLGTPEFARLRIGIGHPGSSSQVVSYVLKRAPSGEAAFTEAAIQESLRYIPQIVRGEFSQAMNELHRFNAQAQQV